MTSGRSARCIKPKRHRNVDVVFRFARDSPLEGTGFEPSVPLSRQGLSAGDAGPISWTGVGGVRQDFEFQSWLLRLDVRCPTGGSDVGYILSAGRADVKQLRELKL